MTSTGIGAAVRRKEDHRFITGKGRYTDDINRPGQAHAYFLRSPHAHAKIKIDRRRGGEGMPGVVAILTGDDIAADKVGGLICGWMIHSKDGTPMKAGAASGAGARQGALRRRPCRGGHRRDARRRRRTRPKRSRSIMRCCRPWSTPRRRSARAPRDPRCRPDNTVFDWHLGDKAQTDAASRAADARHQARPRQQPPGPQCRWSRAPPSATTTRATERYTLYTTSQNPHVARLVLSAFIGIAPEHKLRVIAPDVGGGFGSKIFIYAEETRLRLGGEEGRPPGEMDRGPDRGLPVRRAWPRPRHPCRAGDSTRTARSLALRVHDHRQSRRLPVDLLVLGADLSLCAAAVGPVRHPGDLLPRSTASTPTPRRSTPIAAPGRPEATFVVERLVEVAARELGHGPGGVPPQELHQELPASDAGDHDLRRRRLSALARQGAGASPTTRTSARARRESAKQRQAARHRLLRLYRGLRHRAVGSGGLARRRRRPVGIGRGARQPDRHRRGADRLAQPRPGP